jgi:D-3-phosphoglycerate dehydrogenase
MAQERVLITCPPLLRSLEGFRPLFEARGIAITAPTVVQTLSVPELVKLVPEHDGWIIGDDPANREVFTAGRAGRLRAAVKWGVGVDNVDFAACRDLGIPIVNTPHMFGGEVADVAVGYVIALARHTFEIDRGVREGKWPKPVGISLAGKQVALIGFGDIGRNVARRLLAAGMRITAYDPAFAPDATMPAVEGAIWPARVEEADFIVVTSALTPSSRHMVNGEALGRAKPGVRIVNVARGPIIDERALERALGSGQVSAAALDVFEEEPLPAGSPLRGHPACIFGSHNGSNTIDAVERTSRLAIDKLFEFLGLR